MNKFGKTLKTIMGINRLSILILCLCFINFLWSEIGLIDYEKIPGIQSYQLEMTFLFDNQEFYQSYTPQWENEKPKQYYIDELDKIYNSLIKLDSTNYEVQLLLGDIGIFLYNLDAENSKSMIDKHFNIAIKINPSDYRAYWFKGIYLTDSGNQIESLHYYQKAESLVPQDPPYFFYESMAFAYYLGNMPAHTLRALKISHELNRDSTEFEKIIIPVLEKRMLKPDIKKQYEVQDIWLGEKSDSLIYISYPLGIYVCSDTTWSVDGFPYKNKQSMISFSPPSIDKGSKKISSSIAIISNLINNEKDFRSLLKNYINKKDIVKQTEIKHPVFGSVIQLEIKTNRYYKEIGGGHFIIWAFKKNKPEFPGFLLERPVDFNISLEESDDYSQKEKTVHWFSFDEFYTRFDQDIAYFIMLDTCEEAYPDVYPLFVNFVNHQLIIE